MVTVGRVAIVAQVFVSTWLNVQLVVFASIFDCVGGGEAR